MTTKTEIQLESLKNRLHNLGRKTREESSQLQTKAIMVVTAAGIGFIEGQEEATRQASAFRVGGFTPAQVIGLGAAAAEVWSDDRDTKNMFGGVSNAGLSIAAYQMGRDRAARGATTP